MWRWYATLPCAITDGLKYHEGFKLLKLMRLLCFAQDIGDGYAFTVKKLLFEMVPLPAGPEATSSPT